MKIEITIQNDYIKESSNSINTSKNNSPIYLTEGKSILNMSMTPIRATLHRKGCYLVVTVYSMSISTKIYEFEKISLDLSKQNKKNLETHSTDLQIALSLQLIIQFKYSKSKTKNEIQALLSDLSVVEKELSLAKLGKDR